MPRSNLAKLFQNGSSQAVRLPREFRFQGDSVRIRRVASGVLLESVLTDTKEWFQQMDGQEGCLPVDRKQPVTPRRKVF